MIGSIKRASAALLVMLSVLFTPAVLVAGSAHAETGGVNCVMQWEFNEVHSGMSRNKVKELFGVDQGFIYAYNHVGDVYTEELTYTPCVQDFNPYDYADVWYQKTPDNGYYAVFDKEAVLGA